MDLLLWKFKLLGKVQSTKAKEISILSRVAQISLEIFGKNFWWKLCRVSSLNQDSLATQKCSFTICRNLNMSSKKGKLRKGANLFLFRFRDNSAGPDAPGKRYVITNPPNDFNLLPTDQVCINAKKIDGRVVILKIVSWC